VTNINTQTLKLLIKRVLAKVRVPKMWGRWGTAPWMWARLTP